MLSKKLFDICDDLGNKEIANISFFLIRNIEMADSKKLAFQLSDEQLKTLKPLLDVTGKLKIAGEVEGDRLSVSFLACNMAFLACNMAFTASDGSLKISSK
jgi:hypothetical protein